MPTLNPFKRIQGGYIGKKRGELFETQFMTSSHRYNAACTRIPDGCKQVSKTKLIRVRTPFDWIVSYRGKTAVIDTKSFDHAVLRRSDVVDHQLTHLLDHARESVTAGFVVHHRPTSKVIFYPAKWVLEFLRDQTISQCNGMIIGSIEDFNPTLIFNAS